MLLFRSRHPRRCSSARVSRDPEAAWLPPRGCLVARSVHGSRPRTGTLSLPAQHDAEVSPGWDFAQPVQPARDDTHSLGSRPQDARSRPRGRPAPLATCAASAPRSGPGLPLVAGRAPTAGGGSAAGRRHRPPARAAHGSRPARRARASAPPAAPTRGARLGPEAVQSRCAPGGSSTRAPPDEQPPYQPCDSPLAHTERWIARGRACPLRPVERSCRALS